MDLFSDLDEAKRAKLRELGWRESPHRAMGNKRMWLSPEYGFTGSMVEEQAFAWLERYEKGKNP